MTAADPRKKANGDVRIRPYRIGSSVFTRPASVLRKIAIGSRSRSTGFHAPCVDRETLSRRILPALLRAARVTHDVSVIVAIYDGLRECARSLNRLAAS